MKHSILRFFLTATLIAGSANAQCPSVQYAPRDRERIREQIIQPASTLLLEMQAEAIYVAADDKTFSLESRERSYRFLIEQTRDAFLRADNFQLKRSSKQWAAKLGPNLLELIDGTSLIPADPNVSPRAQAVEVSHLVGSALWVLLYCF